MTVRSRSRLAGLLALTAAASLAGCGGSTKVVSDSTPASSSASASSAGSSSSLTTASSTTGSSNLASSAQPGGAGAGRPRCTAEVLSLGFLGQQGAAGHGEVGFSLRNTGNRTCHTFGYPGILFLTAGGAALPTNAVRNG